MIGLDLTPTDIYITLVLTAALVAELGLLIHIVYTNKHDTSHKNEDRRL